MDDTDPENCCYSNDDETADEGGLESHPTKKQRICRQLKLSPPSEGASHSFAKSQAWAIRALEHLGFERETSRVPKRKVAAKAHSAGVKTNRQTCNSRFNTHLRELKRKRHCRLVSQPTFLSPVQRERSGICAHSILATTLRDNSNHVAIVSKRKLSEAAAQQTTRVHISSVAVADVSYQMTSRLVMGLGVSAAWTENTEKRVDICNPDCTFAANCNELLDMTTLGGRAQLFSCSALHFCEAAPRTLGVSDFLQRSIELARNELQFEIISTLIFQSTTHLMSTCQKIVYSRDGSRIWFAWALILYLVSDVRTHPILDRFGFTDFDVAVADAMSAYGHLQVGNRSRRKTDEYAKEIHSFGESIELAALISNMNSTEVNCWVVEPAKPDVPETSVSMMISEGSLEVISTALTLKRDTLLSRKVRRVQSTRISGSPRPHPLPKNDDVVSYTGAPGIKVLEFFHHHFSQTDIKCMDQQQKSYLNIESPERDRIARLMVSNCSLKHLVSEDSNAAARAATNLLEWQTDGVEYDDELIEVSKQAALYTRSQMLKLLVQTPNQSPAIATWLARMAPSAAMPSRPRRYVGVNMTGEGNALVMLCVPAGGSPNTLWAMPPPHQHANVLWMTNSLRTQTSASKRVGEAVEALAFHKNNIGMAPRNKIFAQLRASETSDGPSPPLISGLTRSVLVFAACLIVNNETVLASGRVRDAVLNAVQLAASSVKASDLHSDRACFEIRNDTDSLSCIQTPHTTPSNLFTVGMHLSECFRFAYAQIHAKQSPLIAHIAPVSAVQQDSQELVNPSLRPWALLHPMDIRFDRLSGTSDRIVETTERRENVETSVAVGITVCADHAVPVMAALHKFSLLVAAQTTEEAQVCTLKKLRSVLFMSGVQCCSLNEFTNAVSAREMNTSIDGTSKVHSPDNHRCGFFTPFQAYICGHTNVPTMFNRTRWSGAYGSHYDCGSLASVGNASKHVVSDGRLPVPSIMMEDEQLNKLCAEFGAYTVAITKNSSSGKRFEVIPTELWGLPRYLIPGVHSALKYLCKAFQHIRVLTDAENSDTVMSIQVLPFSPFTEATPPVTNSTQWRGFRDQCRPNGGMATHRCDNTLPEASILSSPLFSTARVKMTQPADCFFERIDPYASNALILLIQIGCIAQTLHVLESAGNDFYDLPAAMNTLRSVCSHVHNSSGRQLSNVQAVLAFDALILLNLCMPLSFHAGDFVILDAYAKAPSAAIRNQCKTLVDVPNITIDEAKAATSYWLSLEGPTWKATASFVTALHRRASTLKNTLTDLKEVAAEFESWARSLWHLHAGPAGSAPPPSSPLAGCISPERMHSRHVNCVFTERVGTGHSVPLPRGALFGVANNSLNQVMCLLTGSFLPGIEVQLARNEGNLMLRATCSALKKGELGAEPSLKSTSPVNSEGDSEAFGTFEAKKRQALKQRVAWTKNNRILFDLTKHMLFDEFSGSMRGSTDSFSVTSAKVAAMKVQAMDSLEEKQAQAAFAAAVQG